MPTTLKFTSAATVFVENWAILYGISTHVLTDSGSRFVPKCFAAITPCLGIQNLDTTAHCRPTVNWKVPTEQSLHPPNVWCRASDGLGQLYTTADETVQRSRYRDWRAWRHSAWNCLLTLQAWLQKSWPAQYQMTWLKSECRKPSAVDSCAR